MTKKLLAIPIVILLPISLMAWHPAMAASPPVLITEVQTGFIDAAGVESPKQEFVELTNITNTAVSMNGWRLEYLSAANDGTAGPTSVIDSLTSQISGNGHGIWEHEGYSPVAPDSIFGVGDNSSSGFLAKSGGHVRLMSGTTMIDCISWGSAVVITGCDKVSSVPPAGYTIQRRSTNGVYDKTTGVANLTPATPQGGNIYALTATPPAVIPPVNPVQTTPEPNCDSIQLSEILANPAGDDAQGEFIELYNPTSSAQSLYGCSLRLSNGKQYTFSLGDSLDTHQYKAFTFAATGLQLSNSGTTVTLVTSTQELSMTYPSVGDDEAWALIGGIWYSTDQPTPNAPNLPNKTFVPAATLAVTVVDDLQPCPIGKYRSPVTNRCRNLGEPDSGPAACASNQVLNPDTGRCRKIVTTTVQAPCQPDQERNPDTGRCRKITPAATTPKPCDPGQERNPDTGRCRKIVPVTGGKVLSATTTKKPSYHYLLLGVILAMVAGYGIYEYRHDIANLIAKLRRR